jgi:hypothetical protein
VAWVSESSLVGRCVIGLDGSSNLAEMFRMGGVFVGRMRGVSDRRPRNAPPGTWIILKGTNPADSRTTQQIRTPRQSHDPKKSSEMICSVRAFQPMTLEIWRSGRFISGRLLPLLATALLAPEADGPNSAARSRVTDGTRVCRDRGDFQTRRAFS